MAQPSTVRANAPTTQHQSNLVDERYLDARLTAITERTDRKVEVAAAQSETNFAKLMAKVELIATGVGALDTKISDLGGEVNKVREATATVKWNIIATGLALGGLIFGLLAFGAQMFDTAAGLVGIDR